jgi:phosphate transport system substrate-binding protein
VGVLLLALLSIPFWIGNIGGGDGDTVADAPTEEAMPTEEAAPTEEAMPTEAPTEEASEEMAAEDESAPEAEGDLRELPPVNPATVSGDVYLAGSSVVFPLAQRIAEEFEAEGYTGQLTIDSSGSGAGFERFCVETESDISNASRPIRAEEVQLCVDNGRDPIEYLIGFDAIAVTVSTENDFVEDVTLDELALIFGTAETWADVREEWPAEPIQRYSPGPDSGVFDYFVEEVFDENQEPLLNASNLQQSENDNVLVSGVESSRYAVGFFGYAYYEEEQDRMQILSINSVEPTIESFEVGKYPLARPLLMYTAGDSIKKPQVAAFLNYTLTHVNDLIRDVGYFPPSDAALNESRQTWLDATGN